MASTKLNEDPKAHLVRLVKDFDNAMLVTKNVSEQLRARPMRIAKADVEQNLWFLTSMDSAKIEELMRDPRACITMQKSTPPSASLSARLSFTHAVC
jgi:general stress protein 26